MAKTLQPHYTGRVRFRTGLTGVLILQIEVTEHHIDPGCRDITIAVPVWRDANAKDITRQTLKGAKQ